MKKWESEKHKSWSMPAEGFKGHVATDGSLLGNTGKWRRHKPRNTSAEQKTGKFPERDRRLAQSARQSE